MRAMRDVPSKRVRRLTRCFVLLSALASATTAFAAADQKQVLVVHSGRADTQLPILIDRTLPGALGNSVGPISYYSEYLDPVRFPGAQYQAGFVDYLARKYAHQHLDLVIAAQDVAWSFVAGNHDRLFGNTPVVFSARSPDVARVPNSTGLIADLDLRSTLDLVHALQPDVNQVFVVTGASDRDMAWTALARNQFTSLEQRFAFTYLAGLSTADLERQVATLPEHAILYYVLFYQDGTGRDVKPLDYLQRLSGIANRPIYSWVDSTMDRGTVGGSLYRQARLIDNIRDVSLRILGGEPADSIAVRTEDLNANVVDWRQLQRWGISDRRLPPGTTVLFRSSSVWLRYRFYAMGLVALLACVAVLQVRRRRLARDSNAHALKVNERIREFYHELLRVQEAERTRIARELHDDIGQQAAVLSMHLQRLLRFRRKETPGGTEEIILEALDRTRDIVESTRTLSHQLHPPRLRVLGIVAALEDLAGDFTSEDVSVEFAHQGVPEHIPDEIGLCLFRVAQEAVRNAVQHGKASQVRLDLTAEDDRLMFVIADDGVGFDLDSRYPGSGLLNIDERIQSIGGACTIHSQPHTGTRIELSLPNLAKDSS
jgi:signal transduction histidine kinase